MRLEIDNRRRKISIKFYTLGFGILYASFWKIVTFRFTDYNIIALPVNEGILLGRDSWEGRCLSGRQPPRKSVLRIVRNEFRTLFKYLIIGLCEAGKFYYDINYFSCEQNDRLLRDKFYYLVVEFLLLTQEFSPAGESFHKVILEGSQN